MRPSLLLVCMYGIRRRAVPPGTHVTDTVTRARSKPHGHTDTLSEVKTTHSHCILHATPSLVFSLKKALSSYLVHIQLT